MSVWGSNTSFSYIFYLICLKAEIQTLRLERYDEAVEILTDIFHNNIKFHDALISRGINQMYIKWLIILCKHFCVT